MYRSFHRASEVMMGDYSLAVPHLWHYLLTVSGIETATDPPPYKPLYYVDKLEVITPILVIIGAAPVFSGIIETQQSRSHVRMALSNAWLLVLYILSTSFMEAFTYDPFIHSRF